jgi:hypothetical protein
MTKKSSYTYRSEAEEIALYKRLALGFVVVFFTVWGCFMYILHQQIHTLQQIYLDDCKNTVRTL